MDFSQIETPALILDRARLEKNAARMLKRMDEVGLTLRPHFKTSKSVEVALVATGGRRGTVTASTLKEVEALTEAGFDDILYAVGITPNKFARVRKIREQTGKEVILTLDSPEMARAVVGGLPDVPVMIEVDCGEHRGGIGQDAPEIVEIAKTLGAQFRGIMSHAGHSYSTDQIDGIRKIAEDEAGAARAAAEMLRANGITVDVVSIGSTPTAYFAENLDGIDEIRAGIYQFWDLAQYSRDMCALDDIAVSVLTTVIGHNRDAGVLTVDAGAMAMSKDISAQTFLPEAGFGYLCDSDTMQPTGLKIDVVHQEHGTVRVRSNADFDAFPIGSTLRVLPNHACLTCAAGYGQFLTLDGQVWPRVDGW